MTDLTADHRAVSPDRRILCFGRRARLFGALLGGLAVLLPIRLIAVGGWGGERPSRIGTLYLKLLLWGFRIRVATRGTYVDDAIIVANHTSWTDIMVLGGSRPSIFVAKSEVRDWPLLGMLARLNATLFVDRDARRSAHRQVTAVSEALARGPVVLFPEGTTGSGDAVLPFTSTLLAAAGDRSVQPVSIHYRPRDRDWMPGERAAFAWDGDKQFWPHLLAISGGRPLDCLVIAHDPITLAGNDRKALARVSRDIIAGALDEQRSKQPS